MKKSRIAIIVILSAFTFIPLYVQKQRAGNVPGTRFLNASPEASQETAPLNEPAARFSRDSKSIDYSFLKFTPWDTKKAAVHVMPRARKPYTVMIYMNGSDLESENGAATDDIIEILDSGARFETLNTVLFTGGTNRWQNDVVPEEECALWEIADAELYKITGIGLTDMSDPGTLGSFIDFSVTNFPADKYALILWDHGGGSIAGYGQDEKFNESSLTLLELNYAFEKSVLSDEKIEFLGFDSCLMATVEMSVIASDYFNYMIASEDLEPGSGWDYSFLKEFNNEKTMNGARAGKLIMDYFMKFYGKNSDENLTMSVIDLSGTDAVMEAMGNLMRECSRGILREREASFKTLAKKRCATKTFGGGAPRDNGINSESDMVDAGDMAAKLYDIYPRESRELQNALASAVVYNRHNSKTDLTGLSAYYIYKGTEEGYEALEIYASLGMDSLYTDYLNIFLDMLNYPDKRISRGAGGVQAPRLDMNDVTMTGAALCQDLPGLGISRVIGLIENTENPEPVFASGLWPKINGQNICMYKTGESRNHTVYSVPASVNGRDCDILVLVNDKNPKGKIIGKRQEEGVIVQKGHSDINKGDKISFYLQVFPTGFTGNNSRPVAVKTGNWLKTDEFTVGSGLTLSWEPVNLSPEAGISRVIKYTDCRNNIYYGSEV